MALASFLFPKAVTSSHDKLHPLAGNSATLFFPFPTAPRWPPAGLSYFLHPNLFIRPLGFLFDPLVSPLLLLAATTIYSSVEAPIFLREFEDFFRASPLFSSAFVLCRDQLKGCVGGKPSLGAGRRLL